MKPINLRQKRKQVARAEKRAHGAEAALLHGRTKAQKALEATEKDRKVRHLDAHRRDTGDDTP